MPKLTEQLANAWLQFVTQIGQLWTGSRISGYAEGGPYHCMDCKWAKGRTTGLPFRDANGKGRCGHPIIQLDPKVKIDTQGRKIINLERGCCELVDDSGIVEIVENPLLRETHEGRH